MITILAVNVSRMHVSVHEHVTTQAISDPITLDILWPKRPRPNQLT